MNAKDSLKIFGTILGIYMAAGAALAGTEYLVVKGLDSINNNVKYALETHRMNNHVPEQFRDKKIQNVRRWKVCTG